MIKIWMDLKRGLIMGIGFLAIVFTGFWFVKATWQTSNPGTSSDNNLFINGTGNLTAAKWNNLVNKSSILGDAKQISNDSLFGLTTTDVVDTDMVITTNIKGTSALLIFNGHIQGINTSNIGQSVGLNFTIDNIPVKSGVLNRGGCITNTRAIPYSISWLATGLTPGSHTFKVTGTLNIAKSTRLQARTFQVIPLPLLFFKKIQSF